MTTTRPRTWDINEQEDHELENEKKTRGPRTSKNNKQED
jgi:hypothetical protein